MVIIKNTVITPEDRNEWRRLKYWGTYVNDVPVDKLIPLEE